MAGHCVPQDMQITRDGRVENRAARFRNTVAELSWSHMLRGDGRNGVRQDTRQSRNRESGTFKWRVLSACRAEAGSMPKAHQGRDTRP